MNPNDTIVISYQTLRKIVGVLGLTFPVILVLGSIIVGNCQEIQSSISGYYHTIMRDIFVGVLCIVAFFLFAYNGYDKRDKIAGELACLFALGVAFFPTSVDPPVPACTIIPASSTDLISKLHYVAAALLFFDFTYFSLVLFTRTDGDLTSEKLKRNQVYRVCGYVMLACIVLLGVYFAFFQKSSLSRYKPVFYLEGIALFAFGISWLTKGEIIFGDQSPKPTDDLNVVGPSQAIKPVK